MKNKMKNKKADIGTDQLGYIALGLLLAVGAFILLFFVTGALPKLWDSIKGALGL